VAIQKGKMKIQAIVHQDFQIYFQKMVFVQRADLIGVLAFLSSKLAVHPLELRCSSNHRRHLGE
jgi:hypothetical protein